MEPRGLFIQDDVHLEAEHFSIGSERETGGFTTADIRVNYRFGQSRPLPYESVTGVATTLLRPNSLA